MIPKFPATIKTGKLALRRKDIFSAYISGQKDGDYHLELHKQKGPPKTNQQLAYYYAIVLPCVAKSMKEHGNDSIVVKVGKRFVELALTEKIVDRLLKQRCAVFDGKVVNKADMSIEQAAEFLDRTIMWAAKYLGCVVPEAKGPN